MALVLGSLFVPLFGAAHGHDATGPQTAQTTGTNNTTPTPQTSFSWSAPLDHPHDALYARIVIRTTDTTCDYNAHAAVWGQPEVAGMFGYYNAGSGKGFQKSFHRPDDGMDLTVNGEREHRNETSIITTVHHEGAMRVSEYLDMSLATNVLAPAHQAGGSPFTLSITCDDPFLLDYGAFSRDVLLADEQDFHNTDGGIQARHGTAPGSVAAGTGALQWRTRDGDLHLQVGSPDTAGVVRFRFDHGDDATYFAIKGHGRGYSTWGHSPGSFALTYEGAAAASGSAFTVAAWSERVTTDFAYAYDTWGV